MFRVSDWVFGEIWIPTWVQTFWVRECQTLGGRYMLGFGGPRVFSAPVAVVVSGGVRHRSRELVFLAQVLHKCWFVVPF